jgi:general secretion pathway protein K
LNDERGFALVITLLITALLVALAVEFATEVYVDTSARQSFVEAQQASYLAESGITGGVKVLQLSLAEQSFSSFLDPWAKPLEIEDESGHVIVTIEDESGKLNINQVFGANGKPVFQINYDVAARLLKRLRLSPDLLDALADWVSDSTVYPHPAGGKNAYYNSLKPPYGAKNAKLDTYEELALVRGFNTLLVRQLRQYITIYTDAPGAINLNTAPKEIIASLDDRMSDSLTSRVLEFRKTTPLQAPADLGKVPGLESVYQGLMGLTTTKGTVFRIMSQARVGETVRVIEAVMRIEGSTQKVLYWREF